MHTVRVGVDGVLEGNEVGAHEFGQLPVLKQDRGNGRRDVRVRIEFLKHLLVRRWAGLALLDGLQPEARRLGTRCVEEHRGELLGRIRIERMGRFCYAG